MPAAGPRFAVALLTVCLVGVSVPAASEQSRGAVGIRSDFSGGTETLEGLARSALAAGLTVLVVTDDDLARLEYGLPPCRRLLRWRYDGCSLLTRGTLQTYLGQIERLGRQFPGLVLIDGVRSTPYYRWEVDWPAGRWTLQHAQRRLLTVGLGRREAYAAVPVLGSPALARWGWRSLLLLWPLFGLAYWWLGAGSQPRWARWLVGAIAAACLANNLPLRVPPWDAYAAAPGAGPYQAYIDYGTGQGGLVLWAPPDSVPEPWPIRIVGRQAQLAAEAPDDGAILGATAGYAGLAVLHSGGGAAAEPAGLWDGLLAQYTSGQRARPVWGTGQTGRRGDGGRGGPIDAVQTVFLDSVSSRQAVLEAMGAGRMYAVRGTGVRLVLESFAASRGELSATSGGTLPGGGAVRLSGTLALADGAAALVRVRLVRDGRVVADFAASAPVTFGHVDGGPARGARAYYRLLADTGDSQLASNPIFVDGGAR